MVWFYYSNSLITNTPVFHIWIISCLLAVSERVVLLSKPWALEGEEVSEREGEMPATLRFRLWEDYATCIRHLRLKSQCITLHGFLLKEYFCRCTNLNETRQSELFEIICPAQKSQPHTNSIPLFYNNL